MCGIAAILGTSVNEPTARQMLAAQAHRGPDAQGIYHDPQGRATLLHNRLSIIDLTAAGQQPMADASGRYHIVFNGEIYNYLEIRNELQGRYSFSTQADTEVLLAAYLHWGEACLHKLVGMFAFVIWDSASGTAFAARDRFGVKPLYYATLGNALVLASEIKTLWAAGCPKQADHGTWAGYLLHGSYGQPDTTFWQGIGQLPAGHCLHYRLQTPPSIKQWYFFEKEVAQVPIFGSEGELLEHYESLLAEAVRLRFRADVPLGFNLSGGLDSSTLLAMVDRNSPGITAFTFTTGDPRYDELPWVQQMLAATQHPLIECRLAPEDVPQWAARIQHFQDEPYGGLPTLCYAKLFEQARQRGVKVLLDGQGMDEAWAGYDYYASGSGHVVQGSHDSPLRPQTVQPELAALATRAAYPAPFADKVQNLQYRDLFYTKIPRALRFNDRVSMAFSTELREPFLDHRLVEFAFAQPIQFKIKDGERKWALRQLAAKHLPAQIALAPKRPVQTPQREWLRGELKQWVHDTVQAACRRHPDMLLAPQVEQELQAFMNGQGDNSFFVWQWLSLALN